MLVTKEMAKNYTYNQPLDCYCEFCGKKCHNLNSLKQHVIRCKNNPDRINTINPGFNSPGTMPWNKGLTVNTDSRVRQCHDTYCKNQKAGKHKSSGRPHTEEEKQRLRELALSRGLGGFAWRRGIYYNGIKLDSSYEVIVAESLDLNHIMWERPSRFAYHMENKLHYYTPDFYLPEYDVYLDPKNDFLLNNINSVLGYKDTEKIKQVELENNIKVLVLSKDQLTWDEIKKLL